MGGQPLRPDGAIAEGERRLAPEFDETHQSHQPTIAATESSAEATAPSLAVAGEVAVASDLVLTDAFAVETVIDIASGTLTWGEILDEGDEVVSRLGEAL